MHNRKGYKAFKKGLVCAPDKNHVKQYAENTVFEEDGGVIYEPGMMHYCLNPLDCLTAYPLFDDNGDLVEFCEVEALEEPVSDGWATYATKKLKVGTKIGFADVVNAAVDVVLSETVDSALEGRLDSYVQTGSSVDHARIGSSSYFAQISSSGNDVQIGSSGDHAYIGSSGDVAKIGSSGDNAIISSAGYNTRIGSSGAVAKIGNSGDHTYIGSSGRSAKISSSGDRTYIGSFGDRAKISSSGKAAKITVCGSDSIVAAIGSDSCIKAALGCWITLAEWDYDWDKNCYVPVCVKSGKIDGKTLKPDTWYALKNGEFVEFFS